MAKALFKIPNDNIIYYVEGEWQNLDSLDSDFFVCSRFNDDITGIKGMVVKATNEQIFQFNQLKSSKVSSPIPKDQYLNDVNVLIDKMKQGDLEKVVYSRNKFVESEKQPATVFNSLIQAYPDRFTYLIEDHTREIWLGSSPEILLEGEESVYQTMALAGTQKNVDSNLDNYRWGEKEIEEHLFVVDYIEEIIKPFSYIKGKMKTVNAGPIVHLQTNFNNISIPPDNLFDVLNQLNPTPAVCGFPYQDSLKAISSFEKYQRQYYTGLIGVVHNGKSTFHVNLRCMKRVNSGYELYVGGGLTKDSVSADEWEETELKSQTITQFL